ncbi:MAG TPA: DnaB-like helicase C-terminal domain-containing protein [Leptospiraceae bacterium]|nr:DnaB-like helicase C-terminal domain-containing protein [Leptospiraceae bacterium]HNM92251.1 DnaB-like helicase C-terminal domain-containing protein [Leptospiraceae bacterium]HNN82288.1 DnaB-like helicase C-terminal domain-containing protein [Leptospiraceae bacterium]
MNRELLLLEKELLEKKKKIQKEIAERNLRDSNLASRLTELEILYEKGDYNKLRDKIKFLYNYVDTYESDRGIEKVDLSKAAIDFCNLEEIPFPKNWRVNSTMQPGYMSIISGGTGSGKSRLLIDICAENILQKKHTGIVTIEVVPGSYAIKIAIMLIYKGTGQAIDYKDAKEIIKRGHKDHIERKLLLNAIGAANQYIHVMDMKRKTPQNIYSSVNFLKEESGIKLALLGIDYFQLMQPSKEKELTRSDKNDYMSEELGEKLLELKIPAIVLSQISQGEHKDMRENKTSGTSGLNYSPGLSHVAENIFKIYREKFEDGQYSSKFELRQVKNRDGQTANYELTQEMISGSIIGKG